MTVGKSSSERIFQYDAIRAFACCMVVLMHVSTISPRAFELSWIGACRAIAMTGVPLFFMVSGALLIPCAASWTKFLQSRMPKILILLAVWLVLYAVYFSFTMPAGLVSSLISMLKSPRHLWFLYALAGVYCVIPLLSPWWKLASEAEKRLLVLFWMATTLVPYVLFYFPKMSWYFNCFGYFSGYLGYAVCGAWLGRNYHCRSLSKLLLIAIAGVLVGIAVGTWQGPWMLEAADKTPGLPEAQKIGYLAFTVVLSTIGIWLMFTALPESYFIGRKWISILAANSLGIYLVHIMVLHSLVVPAFARLSITRGGVMEMILMTVTVIVISLLITVGVRKLPWGRYLVGV